MKNLTLTTIALLSCFVATSMHAQVTESEQNTLTPDAVLESLLNGNERYVKGELSAVDITERIDKTKSGQFPKAVILSCLDSRVPVEQVFDLSIGDIFVGRVAGNIENEDQLGSMEFATKVAGAKLVMVLGHESCGAVKGACDNVKMGNLTNLLKKIEPAVNTVTGFSEEERTSKNDKFVAAVVEQNVRQTVNDIRKSSAVLSDLETDGDILIVGAVYSLETGKVTLLD